MSYWTGSNGLRHSPLLLEMAKTNVSHMLAACDVEAHDADEGGGANISTVRSGGRVVLARHASVGEACC
jgi:hypothetical protein